MVTAFMYLAFMDSILIRKVMPMALLLQLSAMSPFRSIRGGLYIQALRHEMQEVLGPIMRNDKQ